jgi:hypothetical protein
MSCRKRRPPFDAERLQETVARTSESSRNSYGWRGPGAPDAIGFVRRTQHSTAQASGDPETLLLPPITSCSSIERSAAAVRYRELLVLRELQA